MRQPHAAGPSELTDPSSDNHLRAWGMRWTNWIGGLVVAARGADEAPMDPASAAGDAFDEEERLIRKHAHDSLAENEQFNLNHAFGLQFARVDAEWSTYEAQMKFEYETQRAQLDGKRQQTQLMASPTTQQGPWKNKVKQSQLIHTAPVFTPDGGAMPKIAAKNGRSPARMANGAAQPSAVSRAVEKEIQNLEQAYVQAQAVSFLSGRAVVVSLAPSIVCALFARPAPCLVSHATPRNRHNRQTVALSRVHAAHCVYMCGAQRIAHQKSNATRWIQRQSNRMQVRGTVSVCVGAALRERTCAGVRMMGGTICRMGDGTRDTGSRVGGGILLTLQL